MGGSDEEKFDHPTQKPVELMRRPILNHTKRGGAVYDPFLGSGTTLIAAEMTGRACYGLELDPKYCDVIIQRWQQFTGKEAILDGTKRSFGVPGFSDCLKKGPKPLRLRSGFPNRESTYVARDSRHRLPAR